MLSCARCKTTASSVRWRYLDRWRRSELVKVATERLSFSESSVFCDVCNILVQAECLALLDQSETNTQSIQDTVHLSASSDEQVPSSSAAETPVTPSSRVGPPTDFEVEVDSPCVISSLVDRLTPMSPEQTNTLTTVLNEILPLTPDVHDRSCVKCTRSGRNVKWRKLSSEHPQLIEWATSHLNYDQCSWFCNRCQKRVFKRYSAESRGMSYKSPIVRIETEDPCLDLECISLEQVEENISNISSYPDLDRPMIATAQTLLKEFRQGNMVLVSAVRQWLQVNLARYGPRDRPCDDVSSFNDTDIFEALKRIFGTDLCIHFHESVNADPLIYHRCIDPFVLIHDLLLNGGKQTAGREFHSESTSNTILAAADCLYPAIDTSSLSVMNHFSIPDNFTEFTFDQLLSFIDSDLWNLVVLLTTPKSKRTRAPLSNTNLNLEEKLMVGPFSDQKEFTKAWRRLVLCYTILQTQNQKCNPLQLLVSDYLHKHSLSSQLQLTLTKFGDCVDPSTLQAHVTAVVDKRRTEGFLKEVVPDAFLIVTVDNLDKSGRWAKVKVSDSGRGWHGTTVCYVQPKPDKLKRFPAEADASQVASTSGCGHSSPSGEMSISQPPVVPALSEDDFLLIDADKDAQSQFSREVHCYCFQRTVQILESVTVQLPGLRSWLHVSSLSPDHREPPSNIVYAPVLNEPADDIGTIENIIHSVGEARIGGEYILIAGDAKTYALLLKAKDDDQTLNWMLPIMGDWHTLKNSQPVLMKLYWHAGLNSIASKCFKNASFLSKIESASNFRHTHDFLVQVWEAIYRVQVESFLKGEEFPGLVEEMVLSIQSFPCLESEVSADQVEFYLECHKTLMEAVGPAQARFNEWRHERSEASELFRFWDQFLHRDMAAYLGLWISIRRGDWALRLASLKEIVPLFHVMDHFNYSKLIPRHLADIVRYPEHVLANLRGGGFVVSLKGIPYASVALDEAHECTINKDIKASISKPDGEYIQKFAEYLPFRARVVKCLESAVRLDCPNEPLHSDMTLSVARHTSKNISIFADVARMSGMFTTADGRLKVLFSTSSPEKVQKKDMLSFRKKGEALFTSHVRGRFLMSGSRTAPCKRSRLVTFAPRKVTKRKLKAKEKDLERRCKIMHQVIAKAVHENRAPELVRQVSLVPRAIANEDSSMLCGTKSSASTYFRSAYPNQVIYMERLPFTPSVVILEGMFIIQSAPLGNHTYYREYADFLLNRSAVHWLRKGVQEVQIHFDEPGVHGVSAKDMERSRRYGCVNDSDNYVISEDAIIPSSEHWREQVLNVPNRKRALCNFLSKHWVNEAPKIISEAQRLVLVGGFSEGDFKGCAVAIDAHSVSVMYSDCNHEESDTRVWLSAASSDLDQILIFSPDTDVYHIGLALLSKMDVALNLSSKRVIIQQNTKSRMKESAQNQIFLDLNALHGALVSDPRLVDIPAEFRTLFVLFVYAITGCDQVSYIHGFSKKKVYEEAFRYASFIWRGDDNENSEELLAAPLNACPCDGQDLCDCCTTGLKRASLCLLRLVGCLYFGKHANAFEASSPQELFHSVSEGDWEKDHSVWLENIRDAVYIRNMADERKHVPSDGALLFHWMRACFIMKIWLQSMEVTMTVPKIENFGWSIVNGGIVPLWETVDNSARIERFVQEIFKGCTCKTGCVSKRCSCVKEDRKCDPSRCRCIRCQNHAS